MKRLQDNPLGMALAGISGVFVLLATVMAVFWSLPVSVETIATTPEASSGGADVLIAHTAEDISAFQVINEKPVFNESRLPVIDPLENEGPVEDTTVAVRDAPKVRLTGIIITPSSKIVSLTPADGKLESVMAYEGQALTGEYVGWQVSLIRPRNVVLESRDGQKLKLELLVHDVKIKEPPKPKPVAKTEPEPVTEDGDQQSRAEQIRQRIAERREELRREQEEKQADGKQTNDRRSTSNRSRRPTRSSDNEKGSEPKNYQSAIRALMNNKAKDQTSDDKKDP